jgi:23S rRNA (adenine-N6)-dimethyltransferase
VARSQPWGWHRLDPRWAEALVSQACVPRGSIVVDVGAGTGAVTAPLVRAGARVIAVEAHRGRASVLRERFGDSIIVVEADAADLRLPRRPFLVVASPPYAVSTELLRRLLHPGSRMVSAHLILQDAAVRRWSGAGAPARSRWAQRFDISPGSRVPRSAFTPRPRVDSRVLVIRQR